ncbi:fatty acid binding protein 1-B.1-like isoform X2 [Hypanus sabinus]|uniref:fatty acid binding protein 1-B.1-like isoform X2 n=1 Tax=Hypanus sabinus TaxID=79690 RepID=UPI0028C3774E|nr:fatty acid binding protein 1-B.1-like isoform X2 [Hypanus sabinus]
MAFTGKYELESQENFEQLMKALGFSDDIIKKYKDKSSTVEFSQDGDSFQCSYHFGNRVITNNFTIGQETEFVSFTGHKVKTSLVIPSFEKETASTNLHTLKSSDDHT